MKYFDPSTRESEEVTGSGERNSGGGGGEGGGGAKAAESEVKQCRGRNGGTAEGCGGNLDSVDMKDGGGGSGGGGGECEINCVRETKSRTKGLASETKGDPLSVGPNSPLVIYTLRMSECQNWPKLAFPCDRLFLLHKSCQMSLRATFKSIRNQR